MLALLAAHTALASAYYFADVGVRAFGRAGAFVAGADDINAQYYNPAALTRIRGGELKFDLAFVNQYVMFDRADEVDDQGEPVVFEPVYNEAAPFKIPNFGVSFNAGLPSTTFAIGLYPPYAPDVSYDPDGPQRFTLVDTAVIQTNFGPSVGHRLDWAGLPWLSLGAGLSWSLMSVEQELVLTTSGNDDPAGDIRFRVAATDRAAFTGNAGLLIEPASGVFAVAASVQPPIRFEARGEMEGNLEDHGAYQAGIITDPVVYDDDVSLTVTMPLILRAGALVRPIPALEVELAAVWQKWDTIDVILVDEVEMVLHTTSFGDILIEGPVELPAGYQNAWSLRLGAEYDVSPHLTVRAGGLYETSAIPPRTQGVGLVDGKKWGYGVGASARFARRFTADVGWSQSFIAPVEITDSEVQQVQIGFPSGEVEDGKVVGNGLFESRMGVFGLGIGVAFGLPDDAEAPAPGPS